MPHALPAPLPPEALSAPVDAAALPFSRTDEAAAHADPVGQERAVEAVRFAIGMRDEGYNLFCMGPEGTGKSSLVRRFVSEAAAALPVPDDWCYVADYANPNRPRALRLPAGRGRLLAKAMAVLVEELTHALPAAFEAEDYRSQRKAIEDRVKQRQEEILEQHRQRAEDQGIAMVRTPVGLALTPIRDGEVIGPDEFKQLPEDEQARARELMQALQKDLEDTLRDMPRWEREKREDIRRLDRITADRAVSHFVDELRAAWDDCPPVLDYLSATHDDILENVGQFLSDGSEQQEQLASLPPVLRREMGQGRFRRYDINVLVSHDAGSGAPMVTEDHPTQPNLIGRIEHRQELGALVTDFTLIRPGALHRANGGFLVVEARKLLMNPFVYDDLKRALRKREVRIEAPGASWGIWSTQTLDPEPIPLEVKVVLLGEPMLYYLLSEHDPDFRELFKVAADFNLRMPRNADTIADLGLLLAAMAREKGLLPLDSGAVARVIQQGARLAGDSAKLSTHMGDLGDLMREAAYFARHAGAEVVSAAHVRDAVAAKQRRQDRIPLAVREEMERATVLIRTEGAEVGQINGLAVMQIGPTVFGRPSRITARVRAGRGEIIDIEREADLSGPLHSKGVMILSSFLAARFAEDGPLGLGATLVFEQSYGPIDGDSASSTELYCLLSALAEAPIRQSLAVTGSVDQFGRVQAIGGVNEKIEGFFDLCQARGLTGEQGVLIPESNIKHLMLRDDVVEACRQGRFAIYPIAHIDQGIALLTGLPAGDKDEKGDYPSGSINRRVAARLAAWARKARHAAAEATSSDTPQRGGGAGKTE